MTVHAVHSAAPYCAALFCRHAVFPVLFIRYAVLCVLLFSVLFSSVLFFRVPGYSMCIVQKRCALDVATVGETDHSYGLLQES